MTPFHYLLFALIGFLIYYVGSDIVKYVVNKIKQNKFGRSEKVLMAFGLIAAAIIILSMIAKSSAK